MMRALFIAIVLGRVCAGTSPTLQLCGPAEEVRLQGTGPSSAVSLLLDQRHLQHHLQHHRPGGVHQHQHQHQQQLQSECSIRITAPDTHLVYALLISDAANAPAEEKEASVDARCWLAFLGTDPKRVVWKFDPCTQHSEQRGHFLPTEFTISWKISNSSRESRLNHLVLTALERGEQCASVGKHTCLSFALPAILCISDELLCDGIPHCPLGSVISDEDPNICQSSNRHLYSYNSWEKLLSEVVKKFSTNTNPAKNGSSTSTIGANDLFWMAHNVTNRLQKNDSTLEDLNGRSNYRNHTAMVTHHSPWGYVMLGVLIGGVMLLLNGLWECCSHAKQTTQMVDMSSSPATTTVLIINNAANEDMSDPPDYEELDQPPSYNTLFPMGRSMNVISSLSIQFNNGDVCEQTAQTAV